MSEELPTLNSWKNETNNRLESAIMECFQKSDIGGWQENHITTMVIDAISKGGTYLEWADCPQRAQWKAYKLNGKHEYNYGDIAVIVKIWLTSASFVEGIAFYEAKKQYFKDQNPTGFRALKTDQLLRISRTTSSSQVLLYDADENQGARATALPTSFAHSLADSGFEESNGRVLHHFGRNWILVLANNFRGFELDFSFDAVTTIKNLATENRLPFVLNTQIAALPGIDLELDEAPSYLSGYSQIAGTKSPPDLGAPLPTQSPGPRY
ncbi:MAG: hypothetical protein K2X80_15430 [Pseudomonadaceae bacterium]|nr:hypothetical protein [Pseudomonadaceae bacterium]